MVTKTGVHFRRAAVVELVDTLDSKSSDLNSRVGSTPTRGTGYKLVRVFTQLRILLIDNIGCNIIRTSEGACSSVERGSGYEITKIAEGLRISIDDLIQ